MIRIALVVCLVVFGCEKKADQKADQKAPSPEVTVSTTDKDGMRVIAVTATADGYMPDRITGKPGEKLKLQFTRTVDASCLSQLKTPDGTLVDLPLNKPVEVAVTVPQTGQVGFACGMDMFHGVIVAEPKT